MFKELIWKIQEPYVKRKRVYYEQQWCENKISAEELCERIAELYSAKPEKKDV